MRQIKRALLRWQLQRWLRRADPFARQFWNARRVEELLDAAVSDNPPQWFVRGTSPPKPPTSNPYWSYP